MVNSPEAPSRQRAGHTLPFVCAVLIVLLFWPSLAEAAAKWKPNTEYEHAFLVLPVSAYLFWRQRDALAALPKSQSPLGLPLLLVGCLGQVSAYLLRIKYIGAWLFLPTVSGAILLIAGPAVLRRTAYLMLLPLTIAPIPNTAMSQLTLHLQTLTSIVSEKVVFSLGYAVVRDGNILSVPGVSIEVAEACSGLHKSLAFLAFAVLFGYIMDLRSAGRVLLLLAAVPVAMLVNVIRVSSLIAIAATWGQHAFDTVHEVSDLVAVGLGFLIFLGISQLLTCSPQKQPSAA